MEGAKSAYEHRHCVICGSAIYPPYQDSPGTPPLCSDRCREIWLRTGVQEGPLHKHCVVCGKPIPFMYTTPGEPPLCSAECRAKYEAQRARTTKWQSIFNVVLILMLVWLLIAVLLPMITP